MLITEYPEVSSLLADNVFLLDGPSGTKKTKASNMLFELMDTTEKENIVPLKRSIWRGKNLGTAVTQEQYNEIEAGTFKDLFLGDYWEIGGRIWRIVDFDYWWNCGDAACTTHHLIIMPDHALYDAKMNDTNVTTGGYVGSKMYTNYIAQAKTIVNTAFTSQHILNHREYLVNAVTNGYPSGGAWFDSTIELPNEIMMYGSYIFTPAGNGSIIPARYTINKSQLAGMKASPILINPHRENQWLRDPVSGTVFARVGDNGRADSSLASYAIGVRCVFGLKK